MPQINLLQEDKARLEHDYAILEADSQATVNDKREVERSLQHVQLENAKLRAKDLSPRGKPRPARYKLSSADELSRPVAAGSTVRQLDTPPHSPENVRRFSAFGADDSGVGGDLGGFGSRSGAGSRLSLPGRGLAEHGLLSAGDLGARLVESRSSGRNSLGSGLEGLPPRPSSAERNPNMTCTSVGMGRSQSSSTYGVGIRRAPQGKLAGILASAIPDIAD